MSRQSIQVAEQGTLEAVLSAVQNIQTNISSMGSPIKNITRGVYDAPISVMLHPNMSPYAKLSVPDIMINNIDLNKSVLTISNEIFYVAVSLKKQIIDKGSYPMFTIVSAQGSYRPTEWKVFNPPIRLLENKINIQDDDMIFINLPRSAEAGSTTPTFCSFEIYSYSNAAPAINSPVKIGYSAKYSEYYTYTIPIDVETEIPLRYSFDWQVIEFN